jgi:hypothetical protein
MKLLWLSTGEVLEIDETRDKLKGGGEGRVFRLAAHPELLAKVFHDPEPRRAKIEAMLRNPPDDDGTPGHRSIAWPVGLLVEANSSRRFAGYLMPRIERASDFHQVTNVARRLKHRPHFTYQHQLRVGLNLARAFTTLHAKEYVVGDVNEGNALVTDTGMVTLVDTDSFQVPRQGRAGFHRCTVGVPEFTPPELQGTKFEDIDRTVEHDRFGLAVLLYKLLMQGYHPFMGEAGRGNSQATSMNLQKQIGSTTPFSQIAPPPQAPPRTLLSPALNALFTRCFDAGARRPLARPRADEWRDALKLEEENLRECSRNPQHWFGKHLKGCVWCDHAARVKDLFPDRAPAKSGSTAQQPLSVPGVSAGSTGTAPPPPPPPDPPPLRGLLDGLIDLFRDATARKAQAEVQPGDWEVELQTQPPFTPGPFLVGCRVRLASGGFLTSGGGGFGGMGLVSWMGGVQQRPVDGQWRYDSASKVLSLRGVVHGVAPFERHLTLTGSGAGGYTTVTPDGLPWALRRLN